MSVQPVLRLDRLFTPGARLGWVFRDPRRETARFGEAEPDPARIGEQVAARAAAEQARYARAHRWLIKPSLAAGLILLLLAGYDQNRHHTTLAVVLLAAAIAAAACGPGFTARIWWRQRRASTAQPESEYHRAREAWQRRADAHRQAELARLGPVPAWSSAAPPT